MEKEITYQELLEQVNILKQQLITSQTNTVFYQYFHNNKAVMLKICAKSQQIVDANAQAAQFYGYPAQKLRQMHIADINTLPAPQIAEKMADTSQRASNVFEFRHRLANGTIKDVEVYASTTIENNQSYQIITVHDIGERKKNMAEKQKLSAAVQQSPVAIVITDTAGNIEYVNLSSAFFILFSGIIRPATLST